MKVRIGITAPLVLENEGQERLFLPHFRDRNFRVLDNLTHAIWIESKTALQSDSKSLETEQLSQVDQTRQTLIPSEGKRNNLIPHNSKHQASNLLLHSMTANRRPN